MEVGTNYEQAITNLNLNFFLNTSLLSNTANISSFLSGISSSSLTKEQIINQFKRYVFVNEVDRYSDVNQNTTFLNFFKTRVSELTLAIQSNPFVPLETSIDLSVPDVYYVNVTNICAFSYMILNDIITTSNSSNISTVKRYDINDLKMKINLLTSKVKESVTSTVLTTYDVFENYVLVEILRTNVTNKWPMSTTEQNIWIIVLQPLLRLIFIDMNMPKKNIVSGSLPQNRSLDSRRISEKNIYKIFIYSLYAFYRKSILLNPDGDATYKLKEILNYFVNSIVFNNIDVQNKSLDTVLASEIQKLQSLNDKSVELNGMTNNLNFLKDQITNIEINKVEIDKKRKNAEIRKWLWLSLLCVYLVAFVVCYMFGGKFIWLVYSFGIGSLVILSGMFILFIYVLVKKYL